MYTNNFEKKMFSNPTFKISITLKPKLDINKLKILKVKLI